MRIGSDIGGTFTDVVAIEDAGKELRIAKVLTTPAQPDDAVVAGAEAVVDKMLGTIAEVREFIHGTTLFTNALIERRGAKTALITTKGFRDVIEIGREHRFDMYDLYMTRPTPLAPRPWRFELSERIGAAGEVVSPLDEDEIAAIAETIHADGIEAVAVCLINAYANNAHEQRVKDVLVDLLPGVIVTLSTELVPEIREVERTSTALANVYVQEIAERYLGRLQSRLSAQGLDGKIMIMQSNGGICDVATASKFPIRLVESGPAGGAIAAAHFGKSLGIDNLLSFDMGGTTAKACLIKDGEPLVSPDFEVDRQYRFTKGSGLPIRVPVIEMIEIGTGGGSIASVDDVGRMTVGPRSASSVPGPACYGRGGTEPTVTDADVILGYLSPDFFLGGEMSLDMAAAEAAVSEKIGAKLDLDMVKAAAGIHSIANESMASSARIHGIERGCDMEKFPVFAYGGAGPVHAYGVARILRAPMVIYPPAAGVMSALGFLLAPISFDVVRSLPGPMAATDWTEVASMFEEMQREAAAQLSENLAAQDITYRKSADMRYQGQGFEVNVELPTGDLGADRIGEIHGRFEHKYKELYGHLVPNAAIEFVSWRIVASGPLPTFTQPEISADAGDVSAALKGERDIYILADEAFAPAPVYDRYKLPPHVKLSGPAIIEERESTVVVAGPGEIEIDRVGNLILTLPR